MATTIGDQAEQSELLTNLDELETTILREFREYRRRIDLLLEIAWSAYRCPEWLRWSRTEHTDETMKLFDGWPTQQRQVGAEKATQRQCVVCGYIDVAPGVGGRTWPTASLCSQCAGTARDAYYGG